MLRGSLEKMGTIIAISIIPRKTPRKNVIIISFIVNLFFLNDVSVFIGASFFTNSYFNKVELSIKTIVSFKAKLDKIDLHRQSLRHSPGLINRYELGDSCPPTFQKLPQDDVILFKEIFKHFLV